MTVNASAPAARSRASAARAGLCPSMRTTSGGGSRPSPAREAYTSSAAGSVAVRALVETTERAPVEAVMVHEETDRPGAGDAVGSGVSVPAGPSAAQSMSSTPAAARSARTRSARGPTPTGAANRARPPNAEKATAALVAGPPAATSWSRATIFSSGSGGASTSWMTSTTVKPQNRPTGRADDRRAFTPPSDPGARRRSPPGGPGVMPAGRR